MALAITLSNFAAALCRRLQRTFQLPFVAVGVEFHIGKRKIEDAEAVAQSKRNALRGGDGCFSGCFTVKTEDVDGKLHVFFIAFLM